MTRIPFRIEFALWRVLRYLEIRGALNLGEGIMNSKSQVSDPVARIDKPMSALLCTCILLHLLRKALRFEVGKIGAE